MLLPTNNLYELAHQILLKAATENGIKASLGNSDNYNRVWARDSAVSALAILSNQLEDLYPAVKASILNLKNAKSAFGQIPSNVAINDDQTINTISFGGPVGRTDTSFWWLIMAVQYLHQHSNDEDLKETVYTQADAIFKLAEAWEFNGKHLMYVPMSSNWADEYVTHGYVLYDQLLRLWALELTANFFNQEKWTQKASKVKEAIKNHYLLEGNLADTFYTQAQKAELVDFDLSQRFIASFSPGDRIEKYDAWSLALLFLLKVPSAATAQQLENAIKAIFIQSNEKGIPAFYPLIKEDDLLYQDILLNHHYRFKNYPGHFHNGGIWPVVNGFLIAGLNHAGFNQTANKLMEALNNNLLVAQKNHPFAEYFDFYKAQPNGIAELCFSAAGYLLAFESIHHQSNFSNQLFFNQNHDDQVLESIKTKTQIIIDKLNLNPKQISAITISGESGCGKTTLSLSLKKGLESLGFDVIILHQDDYFKLPPQQNHQARVDNFDHIGLQEVRLDLLDQHIQIIKEQKLTSIIIPQMDWMLDVEKQIDLKISGINVVIIEGTYTALLQNIDHRIFINTNFKLTKKNREKRNRETVTDFIEQVLAAESKIISQHQKLADIILNHQFDIN